MDSGRCLLHTTILLFCLISSCHAEDWDVMPDSDIAGPVVKQSQGQEENVDKQPTAEAPAQPKKTIAQMIDEALEQEFPKEDGSEVGKNYNETSKMEEASMETVVLVRSKAKEKPAEASTNQTQSVGTTTGSGPVETGNATAKAKSKIDTNVEKEVDRIIDSEDNEYVLSSPKERGLTLTLDPQLIRDLTILITSSATVGLGMEALKQPVINGYFIAGSLVGPGGLKWVKELVQVQSLAQLGVSLLLFALGLEFSLSKLRAVRGVALVGGLVEIVLMSILAGALAKLIGGRSHEGIFTGALVAMSSTSIVVKCLSDTKAMNSSVGQITVGTLILQDCMVGLMFSFMPLLSHASGQPGSEIDKLEVIQVVCRVTATLLLTLSLAMTIARILLQPMVRVLANHASHELYQLALVAFCLLCAMITGYLGLSTELGAFIAGVMLSTTDQQENAMHCIEPVKQMFVTLFIASTGLILSPMFLLQHLPVLTAGLLLVVVSKTLLFSFVVWMFGYNLNTCVAVGISMAQIGEFAFVLLSIARQMDMVQHQLYMLLMGVTAISLLITPSLLQIGRLLLAEPLMSENGTQIQYTKLKHKRSTPVMDVELNDAAEREIPAPAPQPPSGSPLRNRHHDGFGGLSLAGLQLRTANM